MLIIGLFVLVVIFAAFLWLIVVNLDNPVSTQTFSEVTVTIINEDIILSAGDTYQVLGEEKVSVVVSATRQVRQKRERHARTMVPSVTCIARWKRCMLR